MAEYLQKNEKSLRRQFFKRSVLKSNNVETFTFFLRLMEFYEII